MRAITFISARDAASGPAPDIVVIAAEWIDGISARSVALLLCLALVMIVSALYGKGSGWKLRPRRSVRRSVGRPQLRVVPDAPDNMSNPVDQLDAIQRVRFEKVRLLNSEEAPLLPLLERIAGEVGAGHRVMAQTSLGELIRPAPRSGSDRELKNAFASINSKRLDFAIVDRKGFLVCAIEYQGSGHYQGSAVMRDAIKREALRRAEVPFIEVAHKFDPAEVSRTIDCILRPPPPDLQHRHSAVHV